MSRSGRRVGASRTREAIQQAAQRQFAELGYDRASMRSIAAEAGVDPALVIHFFGSKQRLFVAVMQLPFNPAEVIPSLIGGESSTVGARLATFLLGVLEDPEARARITGLVRAAATEPEAARMVREFLTSEVWAPAARQLGVEDAELRISLVGSQIVGLIMARHVVGVEPLASLPAPDVAAAVAPNLQRYLMGSLLPDG